MKPIKTLLAFAPFAAHVLGMASFGWPGMGHDPTALYDLIAFGGDAGDNDVFYQVVL